MKDDFKQLNKEQIEAVKHIEKPSLILAGAGSGKTRVLTYKVLNLIKNHQINPRNILMITFTNKAAAEMKKRVKCDLGFIGTFHSFCVSILRRDGKRIKIPQDFIIYDERDQQNLIAEILGKLELPQKYSPSYILNKISSAKNQLIGEKEYEKLFDDYTSEIISNIYNRYQKALQKNKALDFDDLIFKAVVLFKKHPETLEKYQEIFKYIFVDEFQDTNFAQYILVKLLGAKYQNVTVVGDFSQSIYSWRGAEIRNLEKFKEDFSAVKTFYLEQNYRSTQSILNFAYEIISQNQTHPVLKLFTKNIKGDDIIIQELTDEQEEGIFIASQIQKLLESDNSIDFKSIAVFYRINAQSRVIEETFLKFGIPYILVGGTKFYERKEIKDILSYIRLIVNPYDEISLARILKIGKRRFAYFKELLSEIKDKKENIPTVEIIDRILKKTKYLEFFNEKEAEDAARLENIKELKSVAGIFPHIHEFLERVTLVESEYSQSEKRQKNNQGIYMMTLHQAKGLEFPYVFIIGVEDGILPHSRSFYDMFNLEEERRLFYVGITRAKEKLYLTHVKKRFLFGRSSESLISRFLQNKIEDSF